MSDILMASPYVQRLVFIFALFVAVNIYLIWVMVNITRPDISHCYQYTLRFPSPLPNLGRFYDRQHIEPFPDILDDPKKPEVNGKNIYFAESKCHLPMESLANLLFSKAKQTPGEFPLNTQEMCAIEAASRQNPTHSVYVLFASPMYRHKAVADRDPKLKILESYSNVFLRNVDMWTYSQDTPLESWYRKRKIFKSWHLNDHITDFLRFLTLYRYGGLFLELDVLMLKPCLNWPRNLATLSSLSGISSAALAVNLGVGNHITVGDRLLSECLYFLKESCNSEENEMAGGAILSRVLKDLCDTANYTEMAAKRTCQGMHIYNSKEFEPIPSWKAFELYNNKYTKTVRTAIGNASAVRIWAKYGEIFVKNSKYKGSWLDESSKDLCPLTYNLMRNNHEIHSVQ